MFPRLHGERRQFLVSESVWPIDITKRDAKTVRRLVRVAVLGIRFAHLLLRYGKELGWQRVYTNVGRRGPVNSFLM